jgi:hypothetical protein
MPGRKASALALVTLLAAVPACTRPAAAPVPVDEPGAPPAVGINISQPDDTGPDHLFADALRTYRLLAAPGQSAPPAVDDHGDPLGDFSAFLWDGAGLRENTTGAYALRFTGQADVSVGNADASVTDLAWDATTNTTTGTLTVRTDGGSPIVAFTNTRRLPGDGPGTGVTAPQLMRPVTPGATTAYPFEATFTDAIKALVSRFGVIRMMDYSATNWNGQVDWADRRLPSDHVQQGGGRNGRQYGWQGLGGAWEYAIQLCNETRRDCYINVPEQATDDYVRQLAQLFRYGSDSEGHVYESEQAAPVHAPLDPSLHLYVEYSNEVWNWMFGQAQQNLEASRANRATLDYDGKAGDEPWPRQHAWRTAETSKIFRSVFGDAEMMTRVRPLLEWQYGNAQDSARQTLGFLDGFYSQPVNWFLWGGGGAAYSGVNNTDAGSVDAIYDSGLNHDVVPGTIAVDAAFARSYGLHDVAYEGGFQIGGDRPSDLQTAANLDPRARQFELDTQRQFTEAGGELLMYFHASGANAYAMANPDVFATDTPKLSAIDAITSSPRAAVTNGTPVPATFAGNRWTITGRGWGEPGDGPVVLSGDGDLRWVSYLIRSDGGAVTVRPEGSAPGGGRLAVQVDGTEVAAADVPAGSSALPSAPVTLAPGLHAVRLRAVAGDVEVSALSIS